MASKKFRKSLIIIIVVILFSSTYLSIAHTTESIQPTLSPNHLEVLLKTASKPRIIQPLTINYPRLGCPAILEPGTPLTIEITTLEYEHVYVYLETAHEPIVDAYWLPIEEQQINSENTQITIHIPENIPYETYNLTIFTETYGIFSAQTQPHAITVVDSIDNTYSFVHITDFHVGDPRGFTESIQETLGWKSIKRCITEINLLNPDFVIISGDLVFGQLYFKEYTREYRLLYDMLQLFDVPIYIVPGNHDGYNRIFEDGLEFWTRYFGPLYYSFDYGTSHFQAINSYDMSKLERFSIAMIALNWGGSISDMQLTWIENDLQDSQESELTYMFMHHNPLWETTHDSFTKKPYKNREFLLHLIDIYNVDMVLAGHVHFDNVTENNDTFFITTTTPESEIRVQDGYWGYRMIDINNGKIINYNYKEPKYSIPSYHLSTTQKTAYMQNVTNDLDINISAQLKFILPKGTYIAHNGNIINQRDNHIMTELYVETDVLAQNISLVTIQPI